MKFELEKTNSLSKKSKSDINLNHSKPDHYKATEVLCMAIVLSFITLMTLISSNQLMVNSPTQIVYGLGTQFSVGTFNHTGLEQNTQAFLNNLQQKGGPPIYTLSPDKARAVLSGLQDSHPVQKLSADIENRTIPGGPNAKGISITIVRPSNGSNETPCSNVLSWWWMGLRRL